MNVTVVIPAFEPGEALLALLRELEREPIGEIVVVDDGSGAAYAARFDKARAFARVHVLRHASNQGKGAALKTALRYVSEQISGCAGVVTADADGQHRAADIVRVVFHLIEHPDELCLGARDFGRRVPLRSQIGNRFTRMAARLVFGKALRDTQTGLRGIPSFLVPELTAIASNRYEFELEMLMLASERGVAITEVPIETVYEDGNRGSHFRPVIDSMRVLSVLTRYVIGRKVPTSRSGKLQRNRTSPGSDRGPWIRSA